MPRPCPTPRPAIRAALLVAALGLTACSSAGLDVDGFSPGACTDLAPTLQEIDEALTGLGDDLEPAEAGDQFREAQAALKPAAAGASPEVSSSITDLLSQLGFFRVAVDTGSYDEGRAAGVRTSVDALAQECRTA